MKFNMKVLGISTSFPTFAEVPKADDGEADTVDAGKTKTAVGWPSNWHQLSPRWRAVLLRELIFKVIRSVLQGDQDAFVEFKRITGWGSEEVDSLKAQLAAEREAHEKALAKSEARYVAQTDALLKVEREAHARTLAVLSAIWETAASGGSVADDTDWAAVHDAIAAAKVTP